MCVGFVMNKFVCIVVDKTGVPIRRATWTNFPIGRKRVGKWDKPGGWSVPLFNPLLTAEQNVLKKLEIFQKGRLPR